MAVLSPIDIEGAPPEPEAAPAEAPAQPLSTEPGYVAVASEDGRVESVPVENFGKALANGYRPATRGEIARERDGALGTVASTVGGVARGATFGLSDAAEVGLGRLVAGDEGAERVREGLNEDIEAHPTAAALGEIGGSLLPLAVGAPPVAAEAEGASILARTAAAAPRLFAEGIPFGLGHQLTEDTLGNHDLVAGKYLSAGLEGGLVNLLLGSALHAAGGTIADRLASRGGSTVERDIENIIAKGERSGPKGETYVDANGVRRYSASHGVVLEESAPRAAGAAEAAPGFGQRAVDKLSEMAELQAVKGAMPSSTLGASDLAKLGRTTEEQTTRMRQIGRTLLDEGITTPGASKAVQSQRLATKIEETADTLAGLRKKFASTPVRPDGEAIIKRITEEVAGPLATRPFSTAEYRSLEPYLDEITQRLLKKNPDGSFTSKATFEDLFNLRRELDKKLDPKLWQKVPGTAPAAFEELGKVRGILESEYEAAADRASAHLGEDVSTEYRVNKALFSDLKTAERWAKKAAARESQNRAVSLTDTIMAGAGIASGHGALAVGGAIANKAMRQYGNQAAAYALDRIAKLEVLQRAAAAFDTKLAASTKSFFGHGPAPESKVRRVAITPEERVALRAAVRNPGVLAEHAGDQLARLGLKDAAPNVAGAMTQMVLRAGAWASQKLPPEPSQIGANVFGPAKPRPLGPRGQAELDRAVNALDSDAMLDDLAHRQLSREQIEAVKFVNPPLYNAIRNSVRAYGIEHAPELTIQQEMALSIVFDTPVSSYTRGATIKGFQEAFAQGAPSNDSTSAGGTTGKPIGNGHSTAAMALASPTDRAEAKGEL